MAPFPYQRMRRLRSNETVRKLFRETTLTTDDLICPLFVVPGRGTKTEIESMPGVYHLSVDKLLLEAETILGLEIRAVILFGLPEVKDEMGTAAYKSDGVVQHAVRELKRSFPELVVVTDVCLCQYTTHGHCGIVTDGCIDNDRTIELLAKTALSHAEAGADIIAPSDMMDGRVTAIRSSFESNGFYNTIIMSYAAKYASAFYGPFREAAESSPGFGDRRSYQMDPSNAREALREIELDIAEGADIVMVKPALSYLDVIRSARESFNHPLAAFNVSGEFAMVKAAAINGWLDEKQTVLEILTAIKRAGADLILTYHAKDAALWLKNY
jgi:porphobilinogen synthase